MSLHQKKTPQAPTVHEPTDPRGKGVASLPRAGAGQKGGVRVVAAPEVVAQAVGTVDLQVASLVRVVVDRRRSVECRWR